MKINFAEEKQNLLQKLTLLKDRLKKINSEFFDNSQEIEELVSKIERAIDNTEKEKFIVAFFGAYSDGKSTILSALTDNLGVQIGPAPTTDKVVYYEHKDYILVDTPGLFSEHIIHDEETQKFISEANVTIYTVDPINPLKESHKDVIKWLLLDLKKIDTIIFVINKMDLVADLEDEDDFRKASEIKIKVLRDTIKDYLDINPDNLKIVCISADPFGLGLSHWKSEENYEKYRTISRIEELENMMNDFIANSRDKLITKTGISAIHDTASRIFNEIDQALRNFNEQLPVLQNQKKEINHRIKQLEKKIKEAIINIKDELIALRENVTSEISASFDMESLRSQVLKQIGDEGYILQEKIQRIFDNHLMNLEEIANNILIDIEKSLEFYTELKEGILKDLTGIGKMFFGKIASLQVKILKDGILKIRDFLNLPIKFKPWGADKLAKIFKSGAAALTVLFSIVEGVIIFYQKQKFEKDREEIIKNIEEIFKSVLNDLKDDELVENLPILKELKNIMKSLENEEEKTIKLIDKMKLEKEEINKILE